MATRFLQDRFSMSLLICVNILGVVLGIARCATMRFAPGGPKNGHSLEDLFLDGVIFGFNFSLYFAKKIPQRPDRRPTFGVRFRSFRYRLIPSLV